MPRGKGKGAKGELEAAALLQAWWRRLEPDTVLRRTPGSGGWTRSRGDHAKGDVRPEPGTCSLWGFSVGIKRREECDEAAIANFIRGGLSPVWGWWEQCVRGAEHDGLRPLLLCRGNRMPWSCVLEEGGRIWLFREEAFFALDPAWFALLK